MCKPNSEGGLVVRDHKFVNHSLLASEGGCN